MQLDYFRCEVCGFHFMHHDSTNENKFPVTRRFEDQIHETGLISVRCAQCEALPYILEVGQPYRSGLLGREDTHVITGCNSVYNHWPYAVGHLLEVFPSSCDQESLSYFEQASIEVGFLVEADVNLVVVAYRFGDSGWNVTPYLWHAYHESARAAPMEDPSSDTDRSFTVAIVDTDGGKYRVIRKGLLPVEFATMLHRAIHEQMSRALPDKFKYRARIDSLYELLIENKVDSILQARTLLLMDPSHAAVRSGAV
jgi:hypothetical protein